MHSGYSGGEEHQEEGPVILACGGFGADFSDDSLLQQVEAVWRTLPPWQNIKNLPPLRSLPTTNGEHCTGDGIKVGRLARNPPRGGVTVFCEKIVIAS